LLGAAKKMLLTIISCLVVALFVTTYLVFPASIAENIYAISNFLVPILICTITIRGCSKKELVYFISIVFGVAVTIGTLLLWLDAYLLKWTIDIQLFDILAGLILLLICFVAYRNGKLDKFLSLILQLRMSMRILFLTAVWVSTFLATMLSYLLDAYSGSSEFLLVGIFAAALVIMICSTFPFILIYNQTSLYYKNLSNVMEKQIKSQLSHYEAMSKINENIKRFKHDYTNLRLGLIETLKHDDATGALAILNTDEMTLTNTMSSYETGSIVLDALLSEKQFLAEKVNASLEFEGAVPGDLLDPVDVCIIFGNAIDNAIEACAGCLHDDKKQIAIRSFFANGFLMIQITNPVADNLIIVNNTIATTKADKNLHGIGLRSIKTAVEKYYGQMALSCEDGIFALEIDLDFNMKDKKF